MKTAENSKPCLWFANLLIKMTTAVNFEMSIQLLKRK